MRQRAIGGTTRIILARNSSIGGHAYTEVYLGNLGAQNNQVEGIIGWLKEKCGTDRIYTHIDTDTYQEQAIPNPTAPSKIKANVPGTDSTIQEKGVFTDVTPPNIMSIDFPPKVIDTAASSQEIIFTAHLTDEISGIGEKKWQ